MSICVDCGLTQEDPKREGGPVVCRSCLQQAEPEPADGWPIFSRWVGALRGRGVFARRDVAQGTILERCWVMPLSVEESTASLKMPVLNRYLFPWVNNQRVIISGDGLIYNFDSMKVTRREPNVECVLRVGISAIEFRALRDIHRGDELCWDYEKARQKPR